MNEQSNRPLKIAIVSGEESGDLLGFDLVNAIAQQSGRPVELVGLGGRHLQSLGMKSLFNPQDIALMGLSAVVRDLPRLIWRIGTTAKAIADAKPDCLITIDSPAFSMRVAKKVRKLDPSIPIIKYVCPSVWAWGPWRAKQMRDYIDQVLCILPFEIDVLKKLDGPQGIYVGHRLVNDAQLLAARRSQKDRSPDISDEKLLLILPGSRRAEVKGLLKLFGSTVSILHDRGLKFKIAMPTVPSVENLVREGTKDWPVRPQISTDQDKKTEFFSKADAALAASGTVLLELALARVPMISCYVTDPLVRMASRLVTTWTAALPNLIADQVVVEEYIDEFIRPGLLARELETLASPSEKRHWQLRGFDRIEEEMSLQRPASEVAASSILTLIRS